MSDPGDAPDAPPPAVATRRGATAAAREELAAAFGRDLDPLAAFAPRFETTAIDPFALFITEVLTPRDLAPRTDAAYDCVFAQWRAHMARAGRHPACPSEGHVAAFIAHERDTKANHPDTITEKLRKLGEAYSYWQDDPAFPHPQDYDPFALAKAKATFDPPEAKQPPRIPLDELRDRVAAITNIRARAIITLQLKLGLRVSEVCNLQLADVALAHADVAAHYPTLGSQSVLADRPNAVYIPHDRTGNKSERPRVLPLDDETRHVLLQYLLIRPDCGQPWVFVSKGRNGQLYHQDINRLWKDVFHPTYAETERHRAVTSHFGRHWFTTYWTVDQDINRELVKYMRGDITGGEGIDGREAIDAYIHTYYEDIEELYREQVFKLQI